MNPETVGYNPQKKQGGYQGGASYGGKSQTAFDNKPRQNMMAKAPSTTSSTSTAVSRHSNGSKVTLLTNQYRLNLGSELSFFQYDIQISPDQMLDSFIIQNIFRSIRKKIESIFGLHVISGRSLYSMHDLDETIVFETTFHNIQYNVSLSAESKRHFSGKTLQSSKMEDHNVIFNLINIVIK
jgi:hypothetical protein